ncbi:MAG: selenocysteine-specific translation elongation factor [Dehalococcoidales bacterium]|jgi:selenocysteine-specific elongation factor|nr:selenocysteine-specific translation elongation factor [Dehalococcoidales bacterium]MDP6448708.1 selenocysteine-specific translation elongation factor [Dehalococcoidales bacterium]MDP6577189.1 selenocysteine-specific translation elongation factor [Dehalococcoidales bacterium]
MFVLGTAGHIDHGKSVLVQALTGINPDRLREEKERGMTIDLGFAWLKLPSGREVGIVDVPGHERFVRNMLAGVGSIDMALLIVAANEGVMPQTREHLAILDLLEIPRGLVVITKKDLVDEELLALVRMEIEELISTTAISEVPIMAVSALTGAGLPELVLAIDALLGATEPRRDLSRPRLPIDRVFTMVGSGTVVTGTLVDGSLLVGQEVEVIPAGLKSRLRGLQTHKVRLDMVSPGSRVAVNLVGINTTQLQRGDVLTNSDWLKATTMLTVKLRLLPYLRHPLRHSVTVSFHTGSAETMAKVRLLEGDELKPGRSTWVQLLLDRPVAACGGDHFIIRSPVETLGGGKIVETHTRRLRRFRPEIIENLKVREAGSTEEIVLALLVTKRTLELSALLSQINLPAGETRAMIASLVEQGKLVHLRQGEQSLLVTLFDWERLAEKAREILREYHRKFPTRLGMPEVELGSRLSMGVYASAALRRLSDAGTIIEEGTAARLPAHKIQLTSVQQAKVATFLGSLARNPYAPPGDLNLGPDLLNLLIEQHRVVKVGDGVVFTAAAYDQMVKKVTAYIRAHGKVTLAEVRDLFQTSRKYTQALLEHMDGEKVTRRVGDERVLY